MRATHSVLYYLPVKSHQVCMEGEEKVRAQVDLWPKQLDMMESGCENPLLHTKLKTEWLKTTFIISHDSLLWMANSCCHGLEQDQAWARSVNCLEHRIGGDTHSWGPCSNTMRVSASLISHLGARLTSLYLTLTLTLSWGFSHVRCSWVIWSFHCLGQCGWLLHSHVWCLFYSRGWKSWELTRHLFLSPWSSPQGELGLPHSMAVSSWSGFLHGDQLLQHEHPKKPR